MSIATPPLGRATRRRLAATAAIGLAVVAGLVAGVRWVRSARFDSELNQARADMEIRRYDLAYRRLEPLTMARPDRTDALLLFGRLLDVYTDRDKAMQVLASIPAAAPERPAAVAKAGSIALEFGRYDQAEAWLKEALDAEGPHRPAAASSLGQLYRYQGRLDEVQGLLRRIWSWSDAQSRTFEMVREHAMVEFEPMPVEAVRRVLERASPYAPADPGLVTAWVNLETRLGRLDRAARWLDNIKGGNAERPALLLAKLDWARAGGDAKAAADVISGLPASALTEPERIDLRAWFAARLGDRRAERDRLAERIKESPASLPSLDRLAALELAEGRTTEAAKLRRRKAELDRELLRYKGLLRAEATDRDLPALAEVAGRLGRTFEQQAFRALHSPGPPFAEPPEPAPSTAGLLELIPEAKAVSSTTASAVAEESRPIAFENRAQESGITFTFENGESPIRQMPETMSGGLGVLDFDSDGWLDVYLVQGGPFPPQKDTPGGDRMFRNMGDGSFEDISKRLDLGNLAPGYGHGIAVGDYDNDGDPDVFLTRWRSYKLLRNDGGKLTDVTSQTNLGGDRDWPTSAAWADLDGDGDLDLYVCHYLEWDADNPRPCRNDATRSYTYCDPRVCRARPDHVFRNDNGRFADVSESAGIRKADLDGRGLGVVAADLDQDGKVDLFVANDGTANFFFRNLGGFQFEEVAHESGLAGNAEGGYQAGMGIALGDADNDGLPDLLVTNFYGEGSTFQQNLGNGQFADRSTAVGISAATRYLLGFGTAFADLDNDGLLDLATANGHVNDFQPLFPRKMPAQILRGTAQGRFVDATAGEALLTKRLGRSLAIGDMNNDGSLDFLIQSLNDPVSLLVNRSAASNWIGLDLVGTRSNRDAVGAVVTVRAGGKTHWRTRFGGGSYLAAPSSRIHVGLGDAGKAERVEIHWPSGARSVFRDVAASRSYRATEGSDRLEPWPTSKVGEARGP